MTTNLPLRVGGVEFEIATVPVPGTELTSIGDKLADVATNAYDEAKAAVVALASDFAATIRQLGQESRPREVTMRFGVGFTSQGKVLVMSAGASATIELSLVFDT